MILTLEQVEKIEQGLDNGYRGYRWLRPICESYRELSRERDAARGALLEVGAVVNSSVFTKATQDAIAEALEWQHIYRNEFVCVCGHSSSIHNWVGMCTAIADVIDGKQYYCECDDLSEPPKRRTP